MKLTHHILLFLVTTLTTLSCFAQTGFSYNEPIPIPQSPNAASLGEYGKIGMSNSIGTPDIRIPLFELELFGKKFPAVLSYNASGIKVAQEASWVGLGWSLQLGGCITRTVMDGDDFAYEEQKIPYTGQTLPESLSHHTEQEPYLYSSNAGSVQAAYPDIFHYDTRPDEFYFNFAGHTGAFFFSSGSRTHGEKILTPCIVEQREWLDIRFSTTDFDFIIRDAEGFTYYFGSQEITSPASVGMYYDGRDGIEPPSNRYDKRSIASAQSSSHQAISAWMLDSIVAPNGEAIRFQYENETLFTPVVTNELVHIRMDGATSLNLVQGAYKHISLGSYSNARIDAKRLAAVTSPTLQVSFGITERKDLNHTSDNPPMACKNIVLHTPEAPVQKFTLHQSYFSNYSNNTDFTTCRLRLDSLSIIGKGTTTRTTARPGSDLYYDNDKQTYRFSYYTGILPAKNSRQTDLWGYYNASTAPASWGGGDLKEEGTAFPSMKVSGSILHNTIYYGRNKHCNAKTMQYGTLTDISYPTGGRTHFDYEPHTFTPLQTDMREMKLVNSGYASLNFYSKENQPSTSYISSNTAKTITLSDTSEVILNISYNMLYQITTSVGVRLVILDRNRKEVYKHSVVTSTEVKTAKDKQTTDPLPPGTYTVVWQSSNEINAPFSGNGANGPTNGLFFNANISYNASTIGYNVISQGGGLRLKGQYDIDTNGARYNQRTYTYEGGTHHVLPTFEFSFMADYPRIYSQDGCPSNVMFYYHGYAAQPLAALVPPFAASPVGYSSVTEHFDRNGRIESRFTNYLPANRNAELPGGSTDNILWQGTLQSTRIYAESGSLLKETTYHYSTRNSQKTQALVKYYLYHLWNAASACPTSAQNPNIRLDFYTLHAGEQRLTEVSTNEYLDGEGIKQTVSYNYNNYLQPVDITYRGSDGSCQRIQIDHLPDELQHNLATRIANLTDGQEDFSTIIEYSRLASGCLVPNQQYHVENGIVSDKMQYSQYNKDGEPQRIALYDGIYTHDYVWEKHRITQRTTGGLTTTFIHHGLFGILSATSPSGIVKSYGYDGFGRLTKEAVNRQTTRTHTYTLSSGKQSVSTRTFYNTKGSEGFSFTKYYNGLGHICRTVQVGVTPHKFDLISNIDHDIMMRPVKQYLPTFDGTSIYSDSRPFSETSYESAPIERATASWKPGEAYVAHPAQIRHQVNDDNEVRLLHMSSSGVSCNGCYDKGRLYKQSVVSEDGDCTTTFTDLNGNTVLVRRYLDGRPVDTYYVYDHLSRLRCVLPPLATTMLAEGNNAYDAEFMRQYAYIYTYDNHGDLVEKRLPGCGSIRMDYDKAHRMISCTDGNGRTIKTVYDELGRIIRTTSGGRILTENTYNNTLLTAQRLAVLDSANTYLDRTFSYDERERLIATRQTNLLGGYDMDSTVYSYSSQPLEIWHTHVGSDTIAWRYRFVYDHANRPIKVYYRFQDANEMLLTENSYDELCRLSGKSLYDGLIRQTFGYNLQGMGDHLTGKDFDERLFFADAPVGANPSFTGNISAKADSTALGTNLQLFQYDGLNRLVEASSPAYSARYKFDDMANVTTLIREVSQTTIDSLLLNYEGHRLVAVHDSTHSQHRYATIEYQDCEQADRSMFYDAAGNLTADYDRNILRIEYNLLNLPKQIVFMDSSRIINTYAADGTKLRSVYKTNVATLLFPIGKLCEQEHVACITRTVDYCGDVRYEQDGDYQNTIVHNMEGYYSSIDSAFFAYQKDYQGNLVQIWQVSDSTGLLAEPKLVQLNEYFADGTPTPRTIGEETQPYKYNGNEWIRACGLDAYDFNARMYQPSIARFSSMDPLAHRSYACSPYAFCYGNPTQYTDPFGLAGESYLYGQTGNEHRRGAQSQIEINSTLLAELVCTPQYSSHHSISYVNDVTLLGGWNNYVRQAQYHTAVSNYGMMYNQNNLTPTNAYTASRDWDLRLGDWLRDTFDSHSEEGEQQRIGPYAKGAVLLIPSVSLTNSGKTLITGRDLYGNKAETMDYGLSIIDFATFGASTCNLPKHIAKNNLGIDLGATGYSIFRTIQNEKKKQ